DVKFHDGSPLTAADVAASWNEIIHPREGVLSPRESHYIMVETVEAPDPAPVVFHLKFATAAFCLHSPTPSASFTKRPSSTGIHAGTKRTFSALGQSIEGVRNPDYYHRGLPYL